MQINLRRRDSMDTHIISCVYLGGDFVKDDVFVGNVFRISHVFDFVKRPPTLCLECIESDPKSEDLQYKKGQVIYRNKTSEGLFKVHKLTLENKTIWIRR